MKEKLEELAKEKGFAGESYYIETFPFENTRERLNEVEEISYYLWLCELQKWLREKHQNNVIINPIADTVTKECDLKYTRKLYIYGILQGGLLVHVYTTYQQALEEGLFEALKLVKV